MEVIRKYEKEFKEIQMEIEKNKKIAGHQIEVEDLIEGNQNRN